VATAVQKHLGAFYTSSPVAHALITWAVRRPDEHLLDPSCGEGVFLEAAAERISKIRGNPSIQIYGIEIDKSVVNKILASRLERIGIPTKNIRVADFFEVEPSSFQKFKAVVGNPPFIRYQTFKGASREKALAIAKTLGVSISELTSSWAPFLLNATRFLAPGGRLAMVVPAEISHASYARPVLQYLTHHFKSIVIASFSERLFPNLSQDTYLLFADHFGGACKSLIFRRFQGIQDFGSELGPNGSSETKISARQIRNGNGRLRNHFLPRELSALYSFLAASSQVRRLGELAKIGIGYVTGSNDFFHLSKDQVREYGIPKPFLKRSLLRSGIAKGLRVSEADWRELRDRGEKVYLLSIPRIEEERLPEGVIEYLKKGMKADVHRAYKCAVRKPWYSVPIAEAPEAFLTYMSMSGEAPRTVWNEPALLATNSLHEIRLHFPKPNTAWKLALAFCCSLSQLSSEIEGHPLGGGMLKLEPSEAEQVLIVRPETIRATQGTFMELDSLVRANMLAAAVDLADELVLRDTLALTWEQIRVLREGRDEVKESRRKKIAASSTD
jgi:adenine-specific DNA-methyltransferase